MSHDTSIIRTEMRIEDIVARGKGISPDRLKKIKKGLLTLHTFEIMAANTYKFQITKEVCELNRQLIAAMCDEMSHVQDFQIKIYEYGFKPNKLRILYWFVGFFFGFYSRLLGEKTILKTGVWVEKKAVEHYDELLQTIEWDEDTRKIIEINQSDEKGHITRWNEFLNSGNIEK